MNDSKLLADTLTSLLARHPTVRVIVQPGLCAGLADFPDKPLHIDVGMNMPVPMNPWTDEVGLWFQASFSGVSRAVAVPWGALLWFGTLPSTTRPWRGPSPDKPMAPKPTAISKADRLRELCAEYDAEEPVAPNVVHVDFRNRCRR